MFCFGSSYSKLVKKRNKEIQQSLHLSFPFPPLASQYLPRLSEVQVQDGSEEIIDDPSIIFFDPEEKPGFVYTAVPFITQGYDFSYDQSYYFNNESYSNFKDQLSTSTKNNNKKTEDVDCNSVFDDSLEGAPTTMVEKDFEMSSRRNSMELEKILGVDHNYQMIDNFIPGMESTRNVMPDSIHQTSYQEENSFTDEFEGLNLYEDNLLTGLNLQNNNRGYISDAESVKTYQDSGIYDDDIDSPKLQSSENFSKVARQLVFDTCADGSRLSQEKYSAFKTPMSSQQSSVESLLIESEPSTVRKRNRKDSIKKVMAKSKGEFINCYCSKEFLDTFLGKFHISDRPKRMIYRYMGEERCSEENEEIFIDNISPKNFDETIHQKNPSLNIETMQQKNILSPHTDKPQKFLNSPLSPSHLPDFSPTRYLFIEENISIVKNDGMDTSFEQQNRGVGKSNKYSHVQAKVQCHRKKGERSPSPGHGLRSKSAGSSKSFHSNNIRRRSHSPGERLQTSSAPSTVNEKSKIKPNKSNTKSTTQKKVFNEKLTFRERAKSRTDSHGIEMYSNLPKEFQEIARRLARQDRELKKNDEQEITRGRPLSRRSSRMSSRTTSLSPLRGRSNSSKRRQEQFNDLHTEYFSRNKDVDRTSKQLSRSSSIRSIPSTPAISRQHPLPELQQRTKSPSVSPGRSPAHGSFPIESGKSKQKSSSSSAENNKGKKKNKSPIDDPVTKLYTFTTMNESFGTSPVSGNNSMFHIVPVR